jgi:flagellar motility protein MotE (MotC chaperone)
MKKLLLGLAGALVFFVLLVTVFFIIFFFLPTGEEDMLAEGEGFVSNEELRALVQKRDSLLADVDSLQALLARNGVVIDSLEQESVYKDANLTALENRLQTKDAEITALRQVEVNAQDMARTFATMTVAELIPIIAKLSDQVVLDIYKHTANKRRKFLLSALGDDRAATLTNRLVKKEGS